MIRPGDLVMVAVSGGPDSTALLHGLYQLALDLGYQLHLFHMDHGLRGNDALADAAYVLRLAAELDLPVTVVRLQQGALTGPGLQAAARGARYQAMERVAAKVGAQRIALGHNRDDQAETVLMRFLRGAGAQGLAGIPPVRGPYIRPLLSVSRAQIEAYCEQQGLTPQTDRTNLKPIYLRNRLRLELMPLLEERYNPNLRESLARMADLLREEDRLLDRLAEGALERHGGLTVAALAAEPRALARRMVRLAAGTDLPYQSVEQVLNLPEQGTHEFHLPGGLRAVSEYGAIRFERQERTDQDRTPILLAAPGQTMLPNLGLLFSVQPASSLFHVTSKEQILLDPLRLPGPLAVRFRRPGDRIWPTGMEGSRKLQDILVDAKVPARQRDRVPLLVAGEEILWVVGLRADRRYLAAPESGDALLVQVFPHL